MKCLQTTVAVMAAIALIGSIGASLQQQASAQGVVVEFKTQFTKLTDDMQKAVLAAATADPPTPDRVQKLLDEYSGNVMALFKSPSGNATGGAGSGKAE
jgi:hypothetical protein